MSIVVPADSAMAPGGSYDKGSVVEYNPPPWGRWMPALVAGTTADKDAVTLEFVMMGVPHEHNVPCSSSRLAPLGVHEHGLPPGFWARPSKNRPGQLAYFDKVTGARYGTVELAWRVHLERVLRMEALPTVCDLNSDTSRRFSWAGTLEVVANLGAAAPGRAAMSDGLLDEDSVEAQDTLQLHDSGVCFSGSVFAELMAAPSPAAVPMSIFANIENAHEYDIADNCQNMESSIVPIVPCHKVLHTEIALPKERIALELMLSELKHGALPEERVAELEGALEASRDRVKELEANLGQGTSEMKGVVPSELGDDLSQAESVHSEANHVRPRCLEVASQSHVAEWESVQSESGSAKENVLRLEELLSRIIAEEHVLQKAVEIANLRRTADVLSGAHEALETREPRFAELLQEIEERQAQLLELSQLHHKKEQNLDKLCLSLQAREQANSKFEEYLKEWEGQINTSKPVIKRQSRHSMPAMGTPPKLPKAKPRALLAASCARMSPRSGYCSVPVPAPAGGVAGRAAAAAAEMTVAAVIARGVPAPHSVSVASSRAGSPQGGRGFQTPRRSLSPATPDLLFRGRRGSAPTTPDLRCRRTSHGGSLSVCSIRSGSSTTAPSSSPESCINVPARSQQLFEESPQVQHYTGVLTHPLYGSEEITIDVTLLTRSEGLWNAVHQNEQISVKWDAKHVRMSDKAGATTLDGQEVLGGMLIGVVTQNGMSGGRFRLKPCPKLQVRHALLKRTCLHREVQMVPVPAVVSRWQAVAVPKKLAVQSLSETGWRTSYHVAFA